MNNIEKLSVKEIESRNEPLSVTEYCIYYKKKYKKSISRAGVHDHITRGNLDAVRYGYNWYIFPKSVIQKQKKGRPKG